MDRPPGGCNRQSSAFKETVWCGQGSRRYRVLRGRAPAMVPGTRRATGYIVGRGVLVYRAYWWRLAWRSEGVPIGAVEGLPTPGGRSQWSCSTHCVQHTTRRGSISVVPYACRRAAQPCIPLRSGRFYALRRMACPSSCGQAGVGCCRWIVLPFLFSFVAALRNAASCWHCLCCLWQTLLRQRVGH